MRFGMLAISIARQGASHRAWSHKSESRAIPITAEMSSNFEIKATLLLLNPWLRIWATSATPQQATDVLDRAQRDYHF